MDVLCYGAFFYAVFVVSGRFGVASQDGVLWACSKGWIVFLCPVVVDLVLRDSDGRALLFGVYFVSANGALNGGCFRVRRAEFRDNVLPTKAFTVIFFDGRGQEGSFEFVRLYHAEGQPVRIYRAVPSAIHFAVGDVRDSRRRVI